jgi:xanthomonalisin
MLLAGKRAGSGLVILLFTLASARHASAEPERSTLPGHVPAAVAGLTPTGRLPATHTLLLAIGLPLRDEATSDELVRQLYDPRSTNFHRFLTPEEFTARFGPTERDYEALMSFAEANGLTVVGRHPNRVVLDVGGCVSNIERAFGVTLRTYRHPTEPRDFFAPDVEPSVPANLAVADMWGLSDYARPTPLARPADRARISPLNYNGSGPGGSYQGRDFRNAYAAGSALTGAGQTAAVVEFDGYFTNDIATYEANCGYSNVPLQNVLLDSVSGKPGYSGESGAVDEVSLDIEMLIAMAPGLSNLMVYEGSNPYDVFNRIATDDIARQISCSWSWGAGPSHNWKGRGTTLDSQLKQMTIQGQSFFESSGDSDAYTGSQALSSSAGPIPVGSVYLTSVGGTSLTMSGSGASWASETVWNWAPNGGADANAGSSGGICTSYAIPSWQAAVNMSSNSGSTTYRNIPDVAATADAVNVVYSNGFSGVFGGTSCAAPLWAGFCALVNQQSILATRTNVGFLNPALYAIGTGANYAACFHDITAGNNIGTSTPGLYYATNGYDLCTGLGTPNGTNLINALVPYPCILTPPASLAATNGNAAAFTVVAGGQPPFGYHWLFNGTNLPEGGNVSGAGGSILTLAPVALTNAGSYSVVVTNAYGSATSSVATLIVVFPPAFSAQPASLALLAGSNAVFSATVSGATPLAYQWQFNGGNLLGATSNMLTLAAVTSADAGSYTLVVTNVYGAATSSVATLTVLLPAAVTVPLSTQTVQCGGNAAFSLTASGTPPLTYQWSLDGAPIAGASGASLLLTNVHLPNHTVAVVVSNLYGSAASSVLLAVQDTLPPVITLHGSNPYYVELGSVFMDPGATAYDLCAGAVPVVAAGTVNTNAVSTNTVTYTAADGNGNTGIASRTVIVRDTTPPTILWSFTNLVIAAGANCTASMPDVTGTNYILATALSGPLTLTQLPTNNAVLPLGTNVVVITVADPYGNASYSTNQIDVEDQTPPVILAQPQSQTNTVGAGAGFSVAATACTPLEFQWLFNSASLAAQTNSSLVLSNLTSAAAGSYSVAVTASGGVTTSAVAILTVSLLPSSVTLASSENPAGFKDSLNFTAAVTPASATGAIQFLTNGLAFDLEPLVGGQAFSASFATLPRGTNLIAAVYSGDANHLPCTNTLAQIVTNHPPTAAPASYTRNAGLPLYIPLTNLAASWSDVDGDTVTLAAIGVSTNGVSVTNNAGTLVYIDPNNVPDQFVCTLTDGWGGTAFQTVAIAVVFPAITRVLANADGSVTLDLTAAPDSTCILEATTNLGPAVWLAAATNTLDATGLWQLTDATAPNFPQRFYRLKVAP